MAPSDVSGIVRPGREPSEGYRAIAHGALFLPRSLVELVLFTTGETAGIIENEQVVPRAREIFSAKEGKIAFFPTFFLETGMNPNIGARVIADFGVIATSLRAGYGGRDTNVAEARLRLALGSKPPAVLSFEALHDERTDMGFLGVGQQPFDDPRNVYLGEKRPGIFREKRDRLIVGFGLRPQRNTELFASTSLTQRRVDDAEGVGESALSRVFAEDSIPGAFGKTRMAYSELALRYDSRESRQAMATGELFEVYGGLGQEIWGGDSQLARTGLRAAGFFSVYRTTNILSPRVVFDVLTHTSGAPVPFRELTSQPAFRGADNRRDDVALTASLDYRWQIVRYVAARIFVDGATVGPSVLSLDWEHIRPAWGFGIDLHSSDAELGRIAFAMSPEGASFLFTFGAAAGFGDRQHRD